jgi:hypothetical protein
VIKANAARFMYKNENDVQPETDDRHRKDCFFYVLRVNGLITNTMRVFLYGMT